MTSWTQVLRSLVLTAIVSFLIPVGLMGGVIGLILLASYAAPLSSLSQWLLLLLLQFLGVFGGGDALEGTVTIGLASGTVGALFDAFTAFRYSGLRR
ncbi:MAG: hypothetical protein HC873_19805 [Leptolyngbyaceae cyanobacterium SL_1_1]|nr:hypothetical protein [Leptolyngbyaceae cyanobacterium RM2_2_21]NJN01050.1 hypothetical protein [Leptolyngbyaceae cyanobacterium RM1_1_2]NJO11505.1 hypothetical protein [Leptolyngbyaceae cyanobacterium SL_1_1]